jgi:hypothetical protein
MLVLPALVVFNSDLDSVAELALGDFDLSALAFLVDASCTVIGRRLWGAVSLN